MTPERWRKVEEIYHAALDVHEEQRAALLKEACAGDDRSAPRSRVATGSGEDNGPVP